MVVQDIWDQWIRELIGTFEKHGSSATLPDGSIHPGFVKMIEMLQEKIEPRFRYEGSSEELRAAIERARKPHRI